MTTKHNHWIDSINISPENLAEEMGNLRYDDLADYLGLLADKIQKDGEKDLRNNKIQLASKLARVSELLNLASDKTEECWKICELHME